jgi:hypothetical protein
MTNPSRESTVIYPVLGSSLDLWFVRISGHGLGNCFYTYFHAVALAEKHGATLVAPPWFCLKIGPLLRGSASKRLYWRMFKPFAADIRGIRKFRTLLLSYRKRQVVKVGNVTEPALVAGATNFVVSDQFTFRGLHPHRALIRERLLGIVKDRVPESHDWGSGNYIAVHVRLGDFAAVADTARINRGEPNLQIPLSWYITLIAALRKRYADKEIYLFSDGGEGQLKPLIELGAKLYRSGSDMTDLLAMAGASVLVGSNSTYSRWAAFLGDMPTIWLKTSAQAEKPSAAETPILFIPLDAQEPALWP